MQAEKLLSFVKNPEEEGLSVTVIEQTCQWCSCSNWSQGFM